MATSINRSSNFYHNTHQIGQGQAGHIMHKQGPGGSLASSAYPGTQQPTTLPGINPQQSLQGGHIADRHHETNKRRPSSFNEFQRSNQGSAINSPASNYVGMMGMSQNLQNGLGSSAIHGHQPHLAYMQVQLNNNAQDTGERMKA